MTPPPYKNASAQFSRGPILLVEDNPADVDLMKRAFSKRGITRPLIVARDGEEALACIQEWEADSDSIPALILLDLKLPKVSGLAVLRQIKHHPKFRTIPVVMLTTSDQDSDVHAAYDLGANSYIVKPINFEKFLEAIGNIEQYWLALNFNAN